MMRLNQFVRARPRCAAVIGMVTLMVAGWLIEHRGWPAWDRSSGSYHRRAFIHGEPGRYWLDNRSAGAIGTVTMSRYLSSQDHLLLLTQIHELRLLRIRWHNEAHATPARGVWRWRALWHFGDARALSGEFDGQRRLWLGYPGEVLTLAVLLAAVVVVPLIFARFAKFVLDGSDPQFRRRAALRRLECPACGYDIRHLPLRRCPECGETWTISEIRSI